MFGVNAWFWEVPAWFWKCPRACLACTPGFGKCPPAGCRDRELSASPHLLAYCAESLREKTRRSSRGRAETTLRHHHGQPAVAVGAFSCVPGTRTPTARDEIPRPRRRTRSCKMPTSLNIRSANHVRIDPGVVRVQTARRSSPRPPCIHPAPSLRAPQTSAARAPNNARER